MRIERAEDDKDRVFFFFLNFFLFGSTLRRILSCPLGPRRFVLAPPAPIVPHLQLPTARTVSHVVLSPCPLIEFEVR